MLDVRINDDFGVVGGQLTFKKNTATSYVLDRQLKGGANGWVFAGEHMFFGPCVVKVVKGRGNNRRDRFYAGLSEVSRLARARSRWVAKAFDASFNGDYFYYSMEFVEGQTLREVLGQELSPRERWRLGIQYVAALWHTNVVLHADPHPGNVIVGPNWRSAPEDDGQLTLIDFGPGWPLVKRSIKHRRRAMCEVIVNIARKLPGYPQYRERLASPHGSLERYVKVLEALEPNES